MTSLNNQEAMVWQEAYDKVFRENERLTAESRRLRERISSWIDMTVNCSGVPQNPDSLPQMLLHEFRDAIKTIKGAA